MASPILTDADIAKLDKAPVLTDADIAKSESSNSSQGKSVWDAVGATITPQMQIEHPILSALAKTGQDVSTIPANFINQFLLNAPRAILNKSGYDFPKSDSPVANVAAASAGIAGGIMNPVKISNPLLAGAVYGTAYSNKDNIGLDKKSVENRFTSGAIAAATGGVLSGIGKFLNSGDVINKYIGTRKKDFLFGRNPGQAVANEGIIAANPEDLSSKISDRLKDYGQKINDTIAGAGTNETINATDVLNKFDQAMNSAATNNDQNLVNRLAEIKTAINNKLSIDPSTNNIQVQYKRDLESLSPSEATDIKRIIGEKAKFTGNPSDDKLVNNVLRDAYGTMRRKIENIVPEVAPLNQRYADLKVANIAIARKDFNKTPLLGLIGGATKGAVGGFLTSGGNPLISAAGAVAEPLFEHLINNTRAKTIQAMIYNAGEKAKQNIASNNQELLGITNILNQSRNR